MEKTIKRERLPHTDSIEELAKFWDTHDLADFKEDLEEAGEPVLVRASAGRKTYRVSQNSVTLIE